MIGVDYDLFWTLNPKSLKPFTKAFDLKQKYDDTMAWTNGLYVRMAIASSLGKDTKYPKQPLSYSKEEANKPMDAEVIKAKMFRQMKILNARFGEGEQDE